MKKISLKVASIIIVICMMLYSASITFGEEMTWSALDDFSSEQGSNQWYYLQWTGSAHQELTWNGNSWTGVSPLSMNAASIQPGDYDAVKEWRAPCNGIINISGIARKITETSDLGDGVKVTIKKNDTILWGPHLVTNNVGIEHNLQTVVHEGDSIYFIVNKNNAHYNDRTEWIPVITMPIPGETKYTGLDSVLGQAVVTGEQEGTVNDPKTVSINVANEIAEISASDIIPEDSNATMAFYGTDGSFTAVESGSVSLTPGEVTDIFVKVSGDVSEVYYKISISRANPREPGPSAPAAPVLVSKTRFTVVLEENPAYEFRVNDGEWQDSNVFTGLLPGTEHSFTVRVKETDTHLPSEPSEPLIVTTDPADYNVWYPPSGTDEMINYAIDLASPGDLIVLPEGTFTINSTVLIYKPITIMGAGADKTILKGTGTIHFSIASDNVRISNIKFLGLNTSNDRGIVIGNVKDFCIKDCEFEKLGWAGIRTDGYDTRGVISNCRFLNNTGGLGYGVGVYGGGSVNWERPLELGTENAVYIEDCYFYNVRHAVASSAGSKYVFRHNESYESYQDFQAVDAHGWEFGDPRGSRSYEIYENLISNNQINYYGILIRGGDGVIFNNRINGVTRAIEICNTTEQNGSAFTYPADDQVRDLYIWGNTKDGAPAGPVIRYGHEHLFHIYPTGEPNSEGGYDIYLMEKPGYVPYAYPHPLTLLEELVPTPPTEPFPELPPVEPIPGDWYSKADFTEATRSLGSDNTVKVRVEFDFVAYQDKLNGVVGYADSDTIINAWNSMPIAIQFSTEGTFKVRNGALYQAENPVGYIVNRLYHIKMEVDFVAQTVDVWVTPPNSEPVMIADDYAFRSDAPSIDDLGKICVKAYSTDNDFSISNHTVTYIGPPIPAESVNINEDNITMRVNDTYLLTVTILPANATEKDVEWASSDTAVAIVDENGLVTALAKGTTAITATIAGTQISDTCIVTVTPPEDAVITVEGPDSVFRGQEFTMEIGFESGNIILDADIEIVYDGNLVEFVKYEVIEGGLPVVVSVTEEPGIDRFILGGQGVENAISDDTPLLRLTFRAKDTTGSCEIKVIKADLAAVGENNEGKQLMISLKDAELTVQIQESPVLGDINGDGIVNVMDLYEVSKNYWKNIEDPDWDDVKAADVSSDEEAGVPDGQIGFGDLVFIALRMLE